jgi:hypothetical protein
MGGHEDIKRKGRRDETPVIDEFSNRDADYLNQKLKKRGNEKY